MIVLLQIHQTFVPPNFKLCSAVSLTVFVQLVMYVYTTLHDGSLNGKLHPTIRSCCDKVCIVYKVA